MHSISAVVALALVGSAAPAIAAPILPVPPLPNGLRPVSTIPLNSVNSTNEPRGVSLGDAGKELGKGLLTGGALAGITAGVEKLAGDNSQQKRELEELVALKRELDARGLSLGTVGKELGKGALTGGGIAALTGLLSGSGSDQASKRELEERGLGSAFGKLVGASEDSLGKVVGSAVAGGAAFGAAQGVTNGVLPGNNKREIKARGFGSDIAKPVAGTITAGATALGLTQGIKSLENHISGDSTAQKRGAGAAEVGKVAADTLGDTIKKGLIGGVGSAIGGTAIGSAINSINNRDVDNELFARGAGAAEVGKVAADTLGDTIKKGLIGGVGSAIGGTAIGSAIDHFEGQKREPLSPIGKGVIGTAAGLGASTIADGAIDKIEGLFNRDLSADDIVNEIKSILKTRSSLNDLD